MTPALGAPTADETDAVKSISRRAPFHEPPRKPPGGSYPAKKVTAKSGVGSVGLGVRIVGLWRAVRDRSKLPVS